MSARLQPGHASRYPASPDSPCLPRIERAAWKGACDLQEVRRRWEDGWNVDARALSHVAHDPAQVDNVTRKAIIKEMERLLGDRQVRGAGIDRAILQEYALCEAAWARTYTSEKNPTIVARYAIEATYDGLFRSKVQEVLDTPVPQIWFHHGLHGEQGQRLRFAPEDSGHLLAIPEQAYGALIGSTDPVLTLKGRVHKVDPFETLRATQLWALDPARPPLSAVRLGAHLIRRLAAPKRRFPWSPNWLSFSNEAWQTTPEASIYQGQALRWVKAMNMGHTAGIQALSLFLGAGHAVVHESDLLPVWACYSVPKLFGAVVLNIPDHRGENFLKTISNMNSMEVPQKLDRWKTEAFWRMPAGLRPQGWEQQVIRAMDQVIPGGVLVIMGDVVSGVTHGAAKIIADSGQFEPQPVAGTSHQKVVVDYQKEPWAPFHVIPATGRMIGCWKRAAGVTRP